MMEFHMRGCGFSVPRSGFYVLTFEPLNPEPVNGYLLSNQYTTFNLLT